MRTLILTCALALGASIIPATPWGDVASAAPALSGTVAVEAQGTQSPQPPQINVEVNRGGRAWYANPVWIAIGAVALLVVIALIVAASRGGGTTVVKG